MPGVSRSDALAPKLATALVDALERHKMPTLLLSGGLDSVVVYAALLKIGKPFFVLHFPAVEEDGAHAADTMHVEALMATRPGFVMYHKKPLAAADLPDLERVLEFLDDAAAQVGAPRGFYQNPAHISNVLTRLLAVEFAQGVNSTTVVDGALEHIWADSDEFWQATATRWIQAKIWRLIPQAFGYGDVAYGLQYFGSDLLATAGNVTKVLPLLIELLGPFCRLAM